MRTSLSTSLAQIAAATTPEAEASPFDAWVNGTFALFSDDGADDSFDAAHWGSFAMAGAGAGRRQRREHEARGRGRALKFASRATLYPWLRCVTNDGGVPHEVARLDTFNAIAESE